MNETKEPTETNKQKKATLALVVGVMVTCILFLCGTLYLVPMEPMTKDAFVSAILKDTKTDTIGTNITLSQTIQGTSDRVTYRYKLKTDCPFWSYEDRYVTTHPLTWLSETAAVETEATYTKITLDGVTLMTGQYFYVPLLDLRQEDETYQDFETALVDTAYQQYYTNRTKSTQRLQRTILATAMVTGFVVTLGMVCWRSKAGA